MHVCVCVCARTHTHTHLQVRIPPDYVEVVLTLADADGSGEIEFAEFKGLFNNLDTPETLGIENEDTIDAMLFQVGGSACQ